MDVDVSRSGMSARWQGTISGSDVYVVASLLIYPSGYEFSSLQWRKGWLSRTGAGRNTTNRTERKCRPGTPDRGLCHRPILFALFAGRSAGMHDRTQSEKLFDDLNNAPPFHPNPMQVGCT